MCLPKWPRVLLHAMLQHYKKHNSSRCSKAFVHRCLESLAKAEGGWPQYLLDMIAETPLEGITEHGLFYR